MKLYDRENRRIIVIRETPDPKYWDKHWEVHDLVETVTAGKGNRLVRRVTSRFLKPRARVLEAGCGIGQNVYALQSGGYQAFGVDFASETIQKVRREFPGLAVFVQDVRNLDFQDEFFDGYWSLGVIEHLWEGYGEVLREARRVVRPSGYLFLCFPYISPLRKFKARGGHYENFMDIMTPEKFYQFILDWEDVKVVVEKLGFRLIHRHPYDATKGIKEEIPLLMPMLQRIYNKRGALARTIRFSISASFSMLAGHSMLLVFRRNEKNHL
jgi:SAM-dependent methyltransferase